MQIHQCGQVVSQGYGMTETSGAGTAGPPDASGIADHYGSAGVLSPNIEAMVVDITTGKPLPPNQQGELWIRGVMVMKGIVFAARFRRRKVEEDCV